MVKCALYWLLYYIAILNICNIFAISVLMTWFQDWWMSNRIETERVSFLWDCFFGEKLHMPGNWNCIFVCVCVFSSLFQTHDTQPSFSSKGCNVSLYLYLCGARSLAPDFPTQRPTRRRRPTAIGAVFGVRVLKWSALFCLPLQPSAGRWSPATSARCSRAASPSCTTSSNTPRSPSTTPASPWTVTSAPWSPSTGSPCLQR